MKHILHIIPSVALKSGGPAQTLQNIIHLSTSKVTHSIFTTSEGIEKEADYPDFNARVSMFSFMGKHSFKWSFPLIQKLLLYPKQNLSFIHIHAGFSLISEISAIISWMRRIPYIYRPLGTLSPYSLSHGNQRLKHLFLPLEKWILKNARYVHCTSNKESEDILELAPKAKIRVIPIPISISRTPHTSRTKTIGFLSRISEKKNIISLIQAFEQLRPLYPEWIFLIAGDGESEEVTFIKNRAQASSGKIRYKGFLQGKEKETFFSEIDFLVLPSAHENFGVVVGESLSYGRPVILTSHVEIASFEQSNTGFIQINSLLPEDIGSSLKMAFEMTEKEYEQRSKDGRSFVERYLSKEQVLPLLLNLYS